MLHVLRDEHVDDELPRHLQACLHDERLHPGRRATPPSRSHGPGIARQDSRRPSSHKAKCDARSSRDKFPKLLMCMQLRQSLSSFPSEQNHQDRVFPSYSPHPARIITLVHTHVFTVSMYSHCPCSIHTPYSALRIHRPVGRGAQIVKRLSDAAPSRSARIIATAYRVFTPPHIFTAAFTPLHHGANVQAAAAPCGGAARPAPDKGAGTQDQQRRCTLHVCADLHQSCVAAPPHCG